MLKIKKLILIIVGGMLLTSCSSSEQSRVHSNDMPIVTQTTLPSETPATDSVVTTKSDTSLTESKDLIEDKLIALIQNLLQTPEALTGGDLLVDDIKTKSIDDIVLPKKFDSDLLNLLSINSHFNIVSPTKIEQASQDLGLDSDLVNNSSMKAIVLARYLQAQYVLYTNITESKQQLILTMQLLMVKSGEIIWQDSSSLPLNQLQLSSE